MNKHQPHAPGPLAMKCAAAMFWLAVGSLFWLSCIGCQKNPSGSTHLSPITHDEVPSDSNPIHKDLTNSSNPATVAESDSATSIKQNSPEKVESGDDDADIEAMIQQAAGPLAHLVPEGMTMLETNLGKREHTLIILSMKSESRRSYFLTRMISVLDDTQFQQAMDIVDAADPVYQDLLDRRARILERERDGKRIEQLLKYHTAAVIKLGMEIRNEIMRTVMTPDQRTAYTAQFHTLDKFKTEEPAADKVDQKNQPAELSPVDAPAKKSN